MRIASPIPGPDPHVQLRGDPERGHQPFTLSSPPLGLFQVMPPKDLTNLSLRGILFSVFGILSPKLLDNSDDVTLQMKDSRLCLL